MLQRAVAKVLVPSGFFWRKSAPITRHVPVFCSKTVALDVGRHRETNMPRRLVFLSLLLATLASQANELTLGPVTLSIGLERGPVLNSLQAHFTVSPNCSDTASCLVFKGSQSSGTHVGSVTFKDGRLVAASRQWGDFKDSVNPVLVTKALLAALESAQAASGSSAQIASSVTKVPGAELTSLQFTFPGRKVSVLTTNGNSKFWQQVSISEFIVVPVK